VSSNAPWKQYKILVLEKQIFTGSRGRNVLIHEGIIKIFISYNLYVLTVVSIMQVLLIMGLLKNTLRYSCGSVLV
jgi:hypothetical protein